MRKHTEGDTVAAVLQLLRFHRIPCRRMNTGATKIGGRFIRFGAPGMADILAVLPPLGRACFLEGKSARGVLSNQQRGFLDEMKAAGALTIVFRTVADVQDKLGLPVAR